MLGGGAMAGAKIERVVGVLHRRRRRQKPRVCANSSKAEKQLVFAEVTPVGGVRAVGGILQLVRFL